MEVTKGLLGSALLTGTLLGGGLLPGYPISSYVIAGGDMCAPGPPSLLGNTLQELGCNKITYQNASELKGVSKNITETDIKAAAAMCQYAYFYLNPNAPDKPECQLLDNWEPMRNEEVNALLRPFKKDFKVETEFKRKASGFNSLLFCQKKGGEIRRYAYCTEGTDKGSPKDWFSNLSQGLVGLAPQYTKSVQNAKLLDKAIGGEEYKLIFIGHSLGGGLASNNALVTKTRHAITFNAAGLNILRIHMTLLLNNPSQFSLIENRKNRIHAYVLKDEILNRVLSKILQPAYGNRVILFPQRSKGNTFDRHGMTNFLTEWGIWWDDPHAIGDFGSVRPLHPISDSNV